MQDQTYNGWTNYATWRVYLECVDGINPHDMGWLEEDSPPLRDSLKDCVESYIIDTCPDGIGRDYALAFISDVNWDEITEHVIECYSGQAA